MLYDITLNKLFQILMCLKIILCATNYKAQNEKKFSYQYLCQERKLRPLLTLYIVFY